MLLARKVRFEQFHAALVDAQRSRNYLPARDSDTPYWDTYEQLVMWKMVNMMRESHGRDFVPFSEIERVQGQAIGHSDYTKKFALYASELVDYDVD